MCLVPEAALAEEASWLTKHVHYCTNLLLYSALALPSPETGLQRAKERSLLLTEEKVRPNTSN